MELINREIKKDKCATNKQRRLYRILAGKKAPRRISAWALSAMINHDFTPVQIRNARTEFKMRKGATRYQRRIVELLLNRRLKKGERITRGEAFRIIGEASVSERREAIRTWRAEELAKDGVVGL